MLRPVSRTLGLSPARRFIVDLMWASRRIDAVTFERRMHLAELVEAREESEPRPGWCSIFIKAYALVCARRPELRRSYLAFPWPRLYESGENIASIAIERQVEGEDAVLVAHKRHPERRSLAEIEEWLRYHRHTPPEEIGAFRRILQLARYPRPLRRLVWFLGMNWGRHRERCLGTFGVSVTAGLGGAAIGVRSPLTTILHYGIFEPDGSIDVRLTFDHRVLDGGTVARVMRELEDTLHGEILAELKENRVAKGYYTNVSEMVQP